MCGPQWRDIYGIAATRHTPLDDTCRAVLRPGLAYIPLAITGLIWASTPPRKPLSVSILETYLSMQEATDYVWAIGVPGMTERPFGLIGRMNEKCVICADAHLADASPAAQALVNLLLEVVPPPRRLVHVGLPSMPALIRQACTATTLEHVEACAQHKLKLVPVEWEAYVMRDQLPAGDDWIASTHMPNELAGAKRVTVHFETPRECLLTVAAPAHGNGNGPITSVVDCTPQTPFDMGCTFKQESDKLIFDQQTIFPLGTVPFALSHASDEGRQRTLVTRPAFAEAASLFHEVASGGLCRAIYADQQARLQPPPCTCTGCPMWRAYRNLVTDCPTTRDRVMLLNAADADPAFLIEHIGLLRQLLRFADLDPFMHTPWIRRQLAREEVAAFYPLVVQRKPGMTFDHTPPWVVLTIDHGLQLRWTDERIVVTHTQPVYSHDEGLDAWCLDHMHPFRIRVFPEHSASYTLELHAFCMASSVPTQPFAKVPGLRAAFGLPQGTIELRVADIRNARVRRLAVERNEEVLTAFSIAHSQ